SPRAHLTITYAKSRATDTVPYSGRILVNTAGPVGESRCLGVCNVDRSARDEISPCEPAVECSRLVSLNCRKGSHRAARAGDGITPDVVKPELEGLRRGEDRGSREIELYCADNRYAIRRGPL